ncbi:MULTISPECIES: GlcG/HbpS family heme-binding protein [Streptomyces]|uniref:GlcG/HbpS family heme-binding protein n=1 Tax=Streptomyces TaxID=1883 RepID=UPI000ED844E0|nr:MULTISPECIES: heme-binding protein [Streptomyces]MBJ6620158.1 heme-binding protein [Streptomyces sp. DHE17-7]MCC8451363.1 heme-binding protein [Streptomyces rochei]RIH61197.1 heme-binding protein [Streptomyces sp. SHP22-7]
MKKTLSRRARIATGGAVLAAVAAGTFGTVAANASAPDAAVDAAPAAAEAGKRDTTTSTHLTIDAATEAAQAALKAAKKEGQRITVAVVDRNGNTILTMRGDGAGPQSYESAVKKAFTAVSWNATTTELAGRLKDAPNLKDIPGTLFLGGGVPVTSGKAPIAGIGVAGAPSGTLDEKFAQAGAEALN